MFSELGFWIMIAGAVLTALGFLGLAFSRIGNEMPDQLRNIESEQASPDHLSDPFPTKIGCSRIRLRRALIIACVRLVTRSAASFLCATRYSEVLKVVRSSSVTGGEPRNVPFGTSKLSKARSACAIAPADSIGTSTGTFLWSS